jgi:hypothetical protein
LNMNGTCGNSGMSYGDNSSPLSQTSGMGCIGQA